jgi:hypothetical protein
VPDRIVELLTPYLSAPWGYTLVGAATFLENSVGAGVIVPGETLVILGGFYARRGELQLPLLMAIVCLAAVAGDNVGFLIGRRFGRGFLERHGRRLFVTPQRLERAERHYAMAGRQCSSAGSSRWSEASASSSPGRRGWSGGASSPTTWRAPSCGASGTRRSAT